MSAIATGMVATMIFSAAALAQPAPPPLPAPQTTAVGNTTQGRHVGKHDKKNKNDNPDVDLIGFLGDYEDAADGLDPVGLAEQTAAAKPPQGKGP